MSHLSAAVTTRLSTFPPKTQAPTTNLSPSPLAARHWPVIGWRWSRGAAGCTPVGNTSASGRSVVVIGPKPKQAHFRQV